MGWKNWPYWLKGGLITIGIVLFINIILHKIIVLLFTNSMGLNPVIDIMRPLFSLTMNADFLSWIFCGGFCIGEEGMIQIFTFIPSYFIIGALIGLIIQKIKSRKK